MAIDFVLAALLVFVFVFFYYKNKKLSNLYSEITSQIHLLSSFVTSLQENVKTQKDSLASYVEETNHQIDKIQKKSQENDSASRTRDQQLGIAQNELRDGFRNTEKAFDNLRVSLSAKVEGIKKDSQLLETNLNSQLALLRDLINEQAIKTEQHSKIQNETNEQLKTITAQIVDLTAAIDLLSEDNDSLRKANRDLQTRLEFFTSIKEDSSRLNETDNKEEEDRLLQTLANLPLPNVKNTECGTYDSDFKKTEGCNVSNQNLTPFDAGDILSTGSKKTIAISDILDEEQSHALELMESSSRNLFITGKAGCGKSFLLNAFVIRTKKKTLKLAPTGIAALHIEGATIHSTFGYENLEKIEIDDLSYHSLKLASEKCLVLKNVEVIIIDEISMVRADIFEKMSKILQILCNNNEPFGGKQIFLFGDLFQLPPVAKKPEKEYLTDKFGGVFFFNAPSYKQGDFEAIELTINHRQKDDTSFFDTLNRVRDGSLFSDDLANLNSRVITDSPDLRRVVTLFSTKAEADRVNSEELEKIEGKEYHYQAEVVLNKKTIQNPNLEAIFPISSDLKLKVGALVMMVANDLGKRWVNGTLGIIEKLTDDAIYVTINEETFEVSKEVFSEREVLYEDSHIKYDDVLSVSQFPVVLAYAITIHKSQGMTYPRVACDISRCFADGQAYVALSRCTSLTGLFLKKAVFRNSIKVNPDVIQFYRESFDSSIKK